MYCDKVVFFLKSDVLDQTQQATQPDDIADLVNLARQDRYRHRSRFQFPV